ncbi:hypothetical protein [Kitasatospora azatica]|uniref:hypothetical protein n=1 Tax=Kitasatospora azatica TaxID=58347 RepID=UPI000A90BD76|nr:hypothetical protein [Kitasatospora azatica]
MSTGSGKDDPLPVKAKSETQAWAQRMTEHMARAAGIQTDPTSVKALFTGCEGRNGESAPDDRYYLMYTVFSAVPQNQHPEVVRKIRDMAEKEGLTISVYQETGSDGKVDAVVSANHTSDYNLRASTAGDVDRMYLSVTSPCLMPPATAATTP